jgi:hypothetical protein
VSAAKAAFKDPLAAAFDLAPVGHDGRQETPLRIRLQAVVGSERAHVHVCIVT